MSREENRKRDSRTRKATSTLLLRDRERASKQQPLLVFSVVIRTSLVLVSGPFKLDVLPHTVPTTSPFKNPDKVSPSWLRSSAGHVLLQVAKRLHDLTRDSLPCTNSIAKPLSFRVATWRGVSLSISFSCKSSGGDSVATQSPSMFQKNVSPFGSRRHDGAQSGLRHPRFSLNQGCVCTEQSQHLTSLGLVFSEAQGPPQHASTNHGRLVSEQASV